MSCRPRVARVDGIAGEGEGGGAGVVGRETGAADGGSGRGLGSLSVSLGNPSYLCLLALARPGRLGGGGGCVCACVTLPGCGREDMGVGGGALVSMGLGIQAGAARVGQAGADTVAHTQPLPSPHTLLPALAPADHVQDEYNTSKFCSSCETELKTTGSRTKACPNPSCSASWNRDVNGTWPLAATVGLPVHHLCWALCTCS